MEYYQAYIRREGSTRCDGNWIWQVSLFPVSEHVQTRNNIMRLSIDFIDAGPGDEIESFWYWSWISWFCSNCKSENKESSNQW